MDVRDGDGEMLIVLEGLRMQIMHFVLLIVLVMRSGLIRQRRNRELVHRQYNMIARIPHQISYINGLISSTEQDCIEVLRLGHAAFRNFYVMLEQRGGLVATRGVSVHEQVAMFLSILGHHQKLRFINKIFKCSTRTLCVHFHKVLNVVLRCHELFLVKPEPVEADSTDERRKWFKGCLGALDDTYIPVRVPYVDQSRYRSRKSVCSVNMLGVCDRNLNFVYVLTGWQGSAADGCVLRDAIYRTNGLQVPKGHYYLCDAGYTNGEGFLALYRGVRYHLQEREKSSDRPKNPRELFNMRHSKARNCIERTFGILKARWAILRSICFDGLDNQNKIILAWCLLYNFIRKL